MRERLFDFFDPDKARKPRRGPDVGRSVAGAAPGGRPLTVSALVARIKASLDEAFAGRVAVVGEISNFKRHTSGHLYFRLKDGGAVLEAVMFRARASRLKFTPEDGMEVVADGQVDVYAVQGRLQLRVDRLTPRGAGALDLAFRQLREKLQREGLFAPEHKKAIPRFPRALGVVTSATGAAIRDIRRTLLRRWPGAGVYLLPVAVQGAGAAGQIAEAVTLLDAHAGRYQIDTILVARGGGSLEDLWAFNEECVARAIFAANTPIVSGVGHEVDVTIADLVADVRAATPTAAAQLASPDRREVRRVLADLSGRLSRTVRERLVSARLAVRAVLRSVVFRDPAWRVRAQVQRADELSGRLGASLRGRVLSGRRRLEPAGAALAALHPARLAERAKRRLAGAEHRLRWALGGRSKRSAETLAGVAGRLSAAHPRHRLRLAVQQVAAARRQLEAMSHRSALRRGFSVTRGEGGEILRAVAQAAGGMLIETELADGRFRSRVEAAGDPKTPPRGRRGESCKEPNGPEREENTDRDANRSG